MCLVFLPAINSSASSGSGSSVIKPDFVKDMYYFTSFGDPFPMTRIETGVTFSKPDNYFGEVDNLNGVEKIREFYSREDYDPDSYTIYYLNFYSINDSDVNKAWKNSTCVLATYYYFCDERKGEKLCFTLDQNNDVHLYGDYSAYALFSTSSELYANPTVYGPNKPWSSYYAGSGDYTYNGAEFRNVVYTSIAHVDSNDVESYLAGEDVNVLNQIKEKNDPVGADSFGWDSFSVVPSDGSLKFLYNYSFPLDCYYRVGIHTYTEFKYHTGLGYINKEVEDNYFFFYLNENPNNYSIPVSDTEEPSLSWGNGYGTWFTSLIAGRILGIDISSFKIDSLNTYCTILLEKCSSEKFVYYETLDNEKKEYTRIENSSTTSSDVRIFQINHLTGDITDNSLDAIVNTYHDYNSDGEIVGTNVDNVVLNDKTGSITLFNYVINDYNQTSVNAGKYDYNIGSGNTNTNYYDPIYGDQVNNQNHSNTVTNTVTGNTINKDSNNITNTGSGGSGGGSDSVNVNPDISINIDDDGNLTNKNGTNFFKGFKTLFGLLGKDGLIAFLFAGFKFLPSGFWDCIIAVLGIIGVCIGIKLTKWF